MPMTSAGGGSSRMGLVDWPPRSQRCHFYLEFATGYREKIPGVWQEKANLAGLKRVLLISSGTGLQFRALSEGQRWHYPRADQHTPLSTGGPHVSTCAAACPLRDRRQFCEMFSFIS